MFFDFRGFIQEGRGRVCILHMESSEYDVDIMPL